MIAFAHKELLLLLLFPYAIVVVWGVRASGFKRQVTVVLWAVTVLLVWGLLYSLYSLTIFYDPDMAFAKVEYIMRDINVDWLLRYLSERYGWLIASVYFAICWFIAWLLPGRKAN